MCVLKTKLLEGDVFRGVCQSFCPPGGGWGRGGYSPPLLTHMGPRILWDMVDKRAVRVLLECFLVDLFNI